MNHTGAWLPVWRRAVTPDDVSSGRLLRVNRGAVIGAGARADALVDVAWEEVERRRRAGTGPVRSLVLLDALLNLPLQQPIRLADLTERESRLLDKAPPGCLEYRDGHVTRILQKPLTVAAVLVSRHRWRVALRAAASYRTLSQGIVVLTKAVTEQVIWEADAAGVGVWIEDHVAGELHEQLPSEPFIPRYVKAAGWLFAERAYATLSTTVDQPTG